jgi:hypothetical protein
MEQATMNITIEEDGTLRSEYVFIVWEIGDKTIYLDGYVTAEELEFIASHMKKNQKIQSRGD